MLTRAPSSIGTRSAPSSRRPAAASTIEDPVLVGGARLLGHHVGAQLHAAPEGPVLDLDLLERAALGLARRGARR